MTGSGDMLQATVGTIALAIAMTKVLGSKAGPSGLNATTMNPLIQTLSEPTGPL